MIERLEATLAKYNELETELTKPEVLSDIKKTRTYSKKMADLEEIVNCYKVYKKVLEDIESTKEMVKDPELGEMAREELEENNKRIEEIMNKKGIKSTDDIKCLIKDSFGNVVDVIPK